MLYKISNSASYYTTYIISFQYITSYNSFKHITHVIIYYITFYNITSYHIILYHIISYHIISYHIISHYAILQYAIQHHLSPLSLHSQAAPCRGEPPKTNAQPRRCWSRAARKRNKLIHNIFNLVRNIHHI